MISSYLTPLCGSYYIYRGRQVTPEEPIPLTSILESPPEGPNFFIKADYLYWMAKQIGLVISASNTKLDELLYPSWQASSGFKVALGTLLNHKGWEAKGEYTWFLNKSKEGASSADKNQYLVAGLDSILPVYQIQQKWEDQFNRLDLTIGRTFIIGHFFSLKPFVGAIGTLENQSLSLQYKEESFSPYNQNDLSQKWIGVGPYSGFQTLFNFSKTLKDHSVNLLVQIGSALSWSNYFTDAKTIQKFTSLNPMFETTFGLAWNYWAGKHHNYNAMFTIALEQQIWFNHNYLSTNNRVSKRGKGHLILQGLTLSTEFGF